MIPVAAFLLVAVAIAEAANNAVSGQCGLTRDLMAGRRIVGGRKALPGEFPYQIALMRRPSNWTPRYVLTFHVFCGGSVIADKWILTAAHCMPGVTPDMLRVVAGTTDISNEKNLTKIEVEKIFVHEQYTDKANDIALLKLKTPVSKTSNGFANSICLPRPGANFKGAGVLSGFGHMIENGDATSPHLNTVTVDLLEDRECMKYGPTYKVPEMLCAGWMKGGKDSCQGDSGGPLAYRQPNGQYVQVGVVSFGAGCARAGTPGVYVRLSNYIDWINNIISKNS